MGRVLFQSSNQEEPPQDRTTQSGRVLFGGPVEPPPKETATIAPESSLSIEEEALKNLKGSSGAALEGATLGFADNILATIATLVANSDRLGSRPFADELDPTATIDAANRMASTPPIPVERDMLADFDAARESVRADQKEFDESSGLSLPIKIAAGGATVLPGMAVLGPATGGAVSGALGGAGSAGELISLEGALSTAVGAGAGAVIGKALPATVRVFGRVFRSMTGGGVRRVFDESGQFTDEAMAAIRRGDLDGADPILRRELVKQNVLTPEQAERFNLFQRRGVAPTRANVTQSVDDFRAQGDALKRSGGVADRVASQDQRLAEVAQEGIGSIRPLASNLQEANASVFSVVDNVVTQADEVVGAAYRVAREQAGISNVVELKNLSNVLKTSIGGDRASGGVISAVRGLVRESGGRKLSVSDAEEIRKQINSFHDSVTPQGRRMIRRLKDALDDDVANVVDKDVFEPARAAKREFQGLIEKSKRNKFDKSRGGFLEDVIDNKIPEEKIIPKLLSGRDDDFLKFKEFLTKNSGESGEQAWREVKAHTLRDALDAATKTAGKTADGGHVFNARIFANKLEGLVKTKKFNALFNSEEQRLIQDIIKIGRLRVPPSSVPQGSGPSGAAVESLRRTLIGRIPILRGAQGLFDDLATIKSDQRLLDPARETASALAR